MTNSTAWRLSSTSAVAVLIGLSSLGLGACSKSAPGSAAAPAGQQVATQDAAAPDTVDLVSTAAEVPALADEAPGAANRAALRARLLRALHATWVTEGKQGPVTHEAIRGEVTAVSATSITVKAKDGVSMTFTVGTDTRVRARIAGSGRSVKGTDSTMAAVKVGEKALVTGVGAPTATARIIVHLTPATPKPTATS